MFGQAVHDNECQSFTFSLVLCSNGYVVQVDMYAPIKQQWPKRVRHYSLELRWTVLPSIGHNSGIEVICGRHECCDVPCFRRQTNLSKSFC